MHAGVVRGTNERATGRCSRLPVIWRGSTDHCLNVRGHHIPLFDRDIRRTEADALRICWVRKSDYTEQRQNCDQLSHLNLTPMLLLSLVTASAKILRNVVR